VYEPTQEEVISIISSTFQVEDVDLALTSLQFKIADSDFKSKFAELAQRLEKRDLVCRLKKTSQGLFIIVTRFPPEKKRRFLSKSWTPRLLFMLVVGLVMLDGFYRTQGVNHISYIGEPIEVAGLYTLALLGILGIHEAGHLAAAKFHKIRTTWPYFIPGIPIIGIPTFGAFIQSRGLTINRDILFDVAIAGPIAGLVIAIIVSIFGAYTSPVIDIELYSELKSNNSLMEINESILMVATLEMFGKGGESQVIMSPLLFAAWIGFLITFLNLLPAWQLDGGHIARTLFGAKWHRIATYASMGILVVLGYYIMAILILFLSSKNHGATPLDDVSPLSKNRKLLYILVVALAILCAPIPSRLFF